ncbi:restriction endonuclease subunit S [uncultured Deefgea sp.]|uniref:restriction endonuclease subunit S n=1 Tax=uncultured Deefgea sp. TaxID=1304914 RepID=UPI00259A1D80|nr:restriction endonuclease subunit S [uncultured Deefgea sp.]
MSMATPKDWNVGILSDYAIVKGGKRLPKGETYSEVRTAYPYIRVTNFENGSISLNDLRYVTEEIRSHIKRYVISSKDLYVSIAGTLGLVGDVPNELDGALLTENAAKIVFNDGSEADKSFYKYFLNAEDAQNHFHQAKGTGGGVPKLALFRIEETPVLSPPIKEQQKIAAILTAVDEVIESTQAQINKLKDLKTGLMQELLTQGIGHTEFKDSPVGRIPKAWRTSKIQDIAGYITSGSRGWAEYYSKSGAIFIRIGNLTREHINFRFNDIVYVNPPDGGEGKRTLVQVGDVLISITADLGIIGVVNESIGEAYVNQHVSLVRLNDTQLSRWVGHYLAHENAQKQFTASNDSGAKAGLNLSAIRNLEIALPPKEEREKIVRALDSVDNDIVNRRNKLSRSMDIKKALMQDLLTGKVRVKTA